MTRRARGLLVLLGVVLAALVVSGIGPRDRLTWVLEVFPAVLAAPVLLLTYRRFPLTTLAYVLIAVHAGILFLGGHHTYAEVPLGWWAADVLGLARNHYDRVGHLAQGFVPAIVVREILVRASPLRGSRWLPVVVVALCLSVSVLYEFVEWWTALISRQAAEAFLGTQGDPWDTQWDMFLCLVGAVLALGLLSRVHDRGIERLAPRA